MSRSSDLGERIKITLGLGLGLGLGIGESITLGIRLDTDRLVR